MSASDPLVEALRTIAGPANVLVSASDTAAYVRDWRGQYPGQARAVVRPATTGEVSAIVRACAQHRAAVVPQGGNTGLTGGSTPDETGREVVLSLRRMNRVRRVDAVDNTMTVEAGVILQAVQQEAARHGRLFPLSLAAEGSATIGGNLATNAGGEHVLRYGNMRSLTLGIEVVLADGRVLDLLSPLYKDNTGYDLRDLFVGCEGTLGVITAAALRLFPAPREQVTAWAAVDTPGHAVALLGALRERLGERVTAFELLVREAVAQVERHIDGARNPLATPAPWFVLAEISETSPGTDLRSQVEAALAHAHEQALVLDVAIAASLGQAEAMWHIRDHVPDAQTRDGASIKHDIAVPLSCIATFLERAAPELLAEIPGVRLVTFGHVGDGNLHYNLSKPVGADDGSFLARADAVHDIVYRHVARLGGSISAEHGIGRAKQAAFLRYKDPVAIDIMRAVKGVLDPAHLLNPGRLLPRD
ncbi:MAG TPA: FAD-binding oxidoreductase [Usitatibacter sp.]|nr:FAD-binding oxidoreductase [Usitatibacter sp.]